MAEVNPHPLYRGESDHNQRIIVLDDTGDHPEKFPIKFQTKKPDGPDGKERDQTADAAEHMRYAASLKLKELVKRDLPRLGHAVIIGGAPSVKEHLEEIRALAANPENCIFAINWTHTWLINNGIVPKACVFFEIDAEPDSVLEAAHPDVTYYICSHCHQKTFDMLAGKKIVLWHSPPNSEAERIVREELFADTDTIGGGISTFTRTMSIVLSLGYRNIDLFGCDSSFPDDGKTHVDGYQTIMDNKNDGMWVWARFENTVRRFRTVGYLALQVEEFKLYCVANHHHYTLKVHGDSLLRFVHENTYPSQYES